MFLRGSTSSLARLVESSVVGRGTTEPKVAVTGFDDRLDRVFLVGGLHSWHEIAVDRQMTEVTAGPRPFQKVTSQGTEQSTGRREKSLDRCCCQAWLLLLPRGGASMHGTCPRRVPIRLSGGFWLPWQIGLAWTWEEGGPGGDESVGSAGVW